MEKLQRFFPHWVLRLKPEMILQNKIKTFCWLNTYKEWNVGRKFGFYLSLDFGIDGHVNLAALHRNFHMQWLHIYEVLSAQRSD